VVTRARVTFVYDDVVPVPNEVTASTGVAAFGDLLSRGVRLRDSLTDLLTRAGCGDAVHLLNLRDVSELRDRLRISGPGQRFLVLSSNIVPSCSGEGGQRFVRKLLHLDVPVVLVDDDSRPTGAVLLDVGLLQGYLDAVLRDARQDYLDDLLAQCETVPDHLELVDLRDQIAFVEFLSSGFAVRHFNQIDQDRFLVTKRSTDKDKMRREANFHRLLPEHVQHFFVQPFGLVEDASGASYRMRRLYVPDAAVQWVHRAFAPADFDRFLEQVCYFLQVRPLREVAPEKAREVADRLYVNKVRERVAAVLQTPVGRHVDALLVAGGQGGLEDLLRAYLALHAELAPSRRPTRLALTHGDLCFSNILYSQPSRLMQFVDPRGADAEDELYSDAYYDVAKLSHSVLGGYDLIHAGLYRVDHDADLVLDLHLDQEGLGDSQEAFVRRVEELGYDRRLLRLYEASLFLSMLPLHVDAPKKALAFALRARQILVVLSPGMQRTTEA
jgi:hypothetical protein